MKNLRNRKYGYRAAAASHYHGRDNAPDLICGQREKAQCKQAG